MNKLDLTKIVAAGAGLDRPKALQTIDAIINTINGALTTGQDVDLEDFGRFDTRTLPQRTSMNPLTRQPIVIPAETYTTFTPYAALFNALN